MVTMTQFSSDTAEFFNQNGYLIKPGLVSGQRLAALQQAAKEMVKKGEPPAEYEADVHYEGAPQSRDAEGGQTIRRFLQVFDRAKEFKQFGQSEQVRAVLKELMQDDVYLVRSHHNSLMSKEPKYSSQTNWHRDIRYWNYDCENLISVWLALGHETKDNGALLLIPGTHRVEFERQNFDEALFFRKDLPENQALIDAAVMAELNPGDVLFFHCRTLHAASNNKTDQTKVSLVFTYRPAGTLPLPGTRSASHPDEKI